MPEKTTPTKATGGDATTPNGKTPTTGDAMFFYMIVKNMKSKADIDWAGVAADHGFKSAEVAKVRFGQVKRKLGIGENNSTPTKAPPKTAAVKEAKVKKTPVKGRRSKKEEGKGEREAKMKMENVPANKVKSEETEDDDPEAQLQSDMDKYINQDPGDYF